MAALKKAVPALTDAQVTCSLASSTFASRHCKTPAWACTFARRPSADAGRVPVQLEKMQLIPTRSFDPNIIQVRVLRSLSNRIPASAA